MNINKFKIGQIVRVLENLSEARRPFAPSQLLMPGDEIIVRDRVGSTIYYEVMPGVTNHLTIAEVEPIDDFDPEEVKKWTFLPINLDLKFQ